MTDFLAHWANESGENAKLAAQEMLIAEVTEAIWSMMQEAGITKTDLAARLGTTKGYVSQLLSGSRNMTLRTLSDVCWALGKEPVLAIQGKTEGRDWHTLAGEKVTVGAGKLHYQRTGNVIHPLGRWFTAA
jgi:DNA-binding Xre family transcriptional regulator